MSSTLAAVTVLLIAVARASAQLPEPNGAFAIGRVTLLLEDNRRLEPLEVRPGPRRMLVDIWYPAERSGGTAEYLNVPAFERALGTDGLRKQLGGAYEAIQAGRVQTHAGVGAPFARSLQLAPVLLFSPGGGMIRELYTAQLEELASHGYIVAAITHSYDGFLAVLPDGTAIVHDSKRWPRIPSVEGEANLNQLEWHTADMLAVLDHLSSLNSASPIAGHMDLTRVGAFGHSFGGVVASHACQKDRRIKACLNQDGAMGMKPFYLDVHNWGMNQAFMLIERPPNRAPLTDNDLLAMKMTRAEVLELVARLNADRDRALASTGRGSYRVLLRRNVTTHMDFSDLPVLSAKDSAERIHRTRVIHAATSYSLAFFDRYVKGLKSPLLERSGADEVVESAERFPPAKRPRR